MPGRLSRLALATAVAACTTAFALSPVAGAALGDGLLGEAGDTVQGTLGDLLGDNAGPGGASASPNPQPASGTPPDYNPPAHGTNPHAQGTALTADLNPQDSDPLPYEPGGGSEEVVVGSSRGEQDGDEYHGHVTIVALFGEELIEGADTVPGETSSGPAGNLNALLGDVCTASAICLTALEVNSATTNRGSTNSFSVLTADVSLAGSQVVNAGVLESEGTISEDGGCQTATGSSSVADANLIGDLVSADVINSSSESRACRNGTETVDQDSQAVGVNGQDVLALVGCTSGTPDTNGGIPLVLELVCNADDSSEAGGTQNGAPFGVREGITVFPLTVLGNLLKVTAAASESHAVAPGPACPDRDNPDCPPPPDCPDPDNPDCVDDTGDARTDVKSGANGPGGDGPSADPAGDQLPFTGADLSVLVLVGLGVMGAGLGLMALADRRRRHSFA